MVHSKHVDRQGWDELMRLEMVHRGTVGRPHQRSQDVGKCSNDFWVVI